MSAPKGPIRTTMKPGQRYVDEPIEYEIRPKPLTAAVKAALGAPPLPVRRVLMGYQRREIVWRKPGDAPHG